MSMVKQCTTLYVISCLFLLTCKSDGSLSTGEGMLNQPLKQKQIEGLFEYIDASQSGLAFVNNMPDSMAAYIFKYEYAFNGGGVAIGDINNDQLPDVYFSGTFDRNRLYLNLGNMKFKDITDQTGVDGGAGLKTGVTMADVNADGLLDIYVCKSGHFPNPAYRANALYINKGNLQFSEEGAKYGLQDVSYSTQSYFADFDTDGDLDMFLVNHPLGWDKKHDLNASDDGYGNLKVIEDTTRVSVSDRLYINEGGKYFDRTKAYGVDNIAFGLGAVIYDANGDGYPDIYVANDYSAPDYLYINQNGKRFVNHANAAFRHIPNSSMGCDVFDANNDGYFDLFVNDMMPEKDERMKVTRSIVKNYDSHLLGRKLGYHDQFRFNTFQLSNGDGQYSDIALLTGTYATDWSWAVLGEDFDYNGYQDLFITNGYLKDIFHQDYLKYEMDSLVKNTPANQVTKAWSQLTKPVKLTNYFYANNGGLSFDNVSTVWASDKPSFSNGAAYSDLDNDGDLDLVVNNINDAAFLMRNTVMEKNKPNYVSITLKGDQANAHGIGSEITVFFTDGSLQKKLCQPGRGFYSCVDSRVHFGFANDKSIDHITVKWPDRSLKKYTVAKTGPIQLVKNEGQATPEDPKPALVVTTSGFPFTHKENEYIDFKREPLLHFENSSEGPCMASADVNGDGSAEIYVGGAHNQAAGLFTLQGDSWKAMPVADFENDKVYEDTGAAFADFDKDGDQDLMVVSGGYQFEAGNRNYQVRYYLNQGKGDFKREVKNFPNVLTNASSITTGDWDSDGDLDVFVGGGAWPGQYPKGDKSFYLQNNKESFSIATCPAELNEAITKAAVSADLDGDQKPELITAGEYQPIRIFKWNGQWQLSQTIDKSEGLWQCLYVADADQDKVPEIYAGNLGLNSFLVANEKNPMRIYGGDFDGNDEWDAIHCLNREGKDYPIHHLEELQTHMTSLRKKYLRYKQFANQTPQDIFGDKLKKGKIFNAYQMASMVFYKEGNRYKGLALPTEAQVSMTKAFTILTIGGQNYIAGIGNFYDTDFEYARYDAGKGYLLSADKNHSYKVATVPGFTAYGNLRSLATPDAHTLVVCGSDEVCRVMRWR